jgi:hypothetical protein
MPFPTKGSSYLAGESEGSVTSSQREAMISENAASTGSHHRFSITSQVPITGPVILASHLLPEERQDPCNSINVLYVNKWLAIEKDAEIAVVTGLEVLPRSSMITLEEEKDDGSTRPVGRRKLFRRALLNNEESN